MVFFALLLFVWVKIVEVFKLFHLSFQFLFSLQDFFYLFLLIFDFILFWFKSGWKMSNQISVGVPVEIGRGRIWMLSLCCHQLLQSHFQISNQICLLDELSIQRSNDSIFLNQFTHIRDLSLLNQKIIQFIYFSNQWSGGTISVWSDKRLVFIKFDALLAGQALEVWVLLLELVVFICIPSSFFV